MDIMRSVSGVFEDKRWVEKTGIGSLIMIVPILNFAAIGYQVRVVRRVVSGSAPEMPDWDDFLGLWREGLWIGLAGALYSLPFFIILGAASFAGLPLLVLLGRDSETAWIPLLLVCVASALLMISYGTVLGILGPAILGTYARKGTFAACFDVPEFLRHIGTSPSAYLTLLLVILAMGILYITASLALLLPVGLIPFLGQALLPLLQSAGMFLIMLVQAFLIGQWLRADYKSEAASSPGDASP